MTKFDFNKEEFLKKLPPEFHHFLDDKNKNNVPDMFEGSPFAVIKNLYKLAQATGSSSEEIKVLLQQGLQKQKIQTTQKKTNLPKVRTQHVPKKQQPIQKTPKSFKINPWADFLKLALAGGALYYFYIEVLPIFKALFF